MASSKNPTGSLEPFETLMRDGTNLHAAGRPELALVLFEQALRLAPESQDAASACATVLTELDRPYAAYRLLLQLEDTLLADADGAANLAITAEACHDMVKARHAYECALAVNPDHLRAMNNLGLLSAAQGLWDEAIALAKKCVATEPADVGYKVNLSDYLMAAGRYEEALDVLEHSHQQSPDRIEVRIRQAVVAALSGDLTNARNILSTLNEDGRAFLNDYLARFQIDPYGAVAAKVSSLEHADAFDLYAQQAYTRMRQCDWQCNDRLTAMLQDSATNDSQNVKYPQGQHALAALFYAFFLDLGDAQLLQLQQRFDFQPSHTASVKQSTYTHRRYAASSRENRLRIGLSVPSLQGSHEVRELLQQLHLHDASRLAMHVYASTPQPTASLLAEFAGTAAQVCEISHMTDQEALGRIRLDDLDVFVDMTRNTACHRRGLTAARVAAVQVLHRAWHAEHLPGHYDYTLSDAWLHPDTEHANAGGMIVRLPHTCWLAAPELPASNELLTREAVGLPEGRLVLGCWTGALNIDPATFSAWMKMLRAMPDAVLFLPGQSSASALNLAREAQSAGVKTGRLLFTPASSSAQISQAMAFVDLFLDPLRVSAGAELVCALQVGVPVLTCSSSTVPSRIGGSIMRAAGLSENVLESPPAYVAAAIQLGRDAAALQRLRQHVLNSVATAPLFDVAARTKHLETAWQEMARRANAGLKATAFDVAI